MLNELFQDMNNPSTNPSSIVQHTNPESNQIQTTTTMTTTTRKEHLQSIMKHYQEHFIYGYGENPISNSTDANLGNAIYAQIWKSFQYHYYKLRQAT